MHKKLSLKLIPATIIIISLSVIMRFSLLYSFIAANIFSLAVLYTEKFDIHVLFKEAFVAVKKYYALYMTILLIGATVSMWLASGVIGAMIYYGFNYINGINFLFFSFIIILICSVFMGTAVGTFSTIGIILYSIGSAIGIPSNILIGTIISGAFVADKIAPLSGLMNLNIKICETSYNQTVKDMLYTLIPTLILTSIVYIIIGSDYIVGSNLEDFKILQNALYDSYNISWYLLLFPLFIILISTRGFNSLIIVSVGVVTGLFVTIGVQGYSIFESLKFILFGFKLDSQNEFLNGILKGGGIVGMVEVIFIVMCAVFLVSLFEKIGIIDYIIGSYIKNIKNPKELVFKTAFISTALTVLTCDQTVGIVLPANMLKNKYDEFGISRGVLARTISDTGIITAPIYPWNINFIIITSIISCDITFIPYAVLCYIFPIITILSGFFIRNKKMTS